MKRDIKLIGLDLDGTVLNDHKEIRPRVKEAIAKALQQGIVVLPATGRQLSGVPKQFLQIPGVRYALTANGAFVYDMEEKAPIHTDCFETKTALSLLEYLEGLDVMIAMYIQGDGYTQSMDFSGFEGVLSPNIIQYMQKTRVLVNSLANVVRQSEKRVEKFSILFKTEELRQKTLATLQARGDNCTTSSISMNLEINTATANKGAGLLALATHLGLQRHQVMAVGDGGNDVEMLKAVGYGVAMGNAEPAVKAAADFVTLPCAEDGVAIAIEGILQ
ncbi:Cof-type HAD-IIB family hydrolase [Ruminococcaceae bacterium OttesenSCG-928-A16]|nr:Cof-type HAD-IIB family hydrolase [Ruminococcaceae bacterium OttesenSCG-928-A16]